MDGKCYHMGIAHDSILIKYYFKLKRNKKNSFYFSFFLFNSHSFPPSFSSQVLIFSKIMFRPNLMSHTSQRISNCTSSITFNNFLSHRHVPHQHSPKLHTFSVIFYFSLTVLGFRNVVHLLVV